MPSPPLQHPRFFTLALPAFLPSFPLKQDAEPSPFPSPSQQDPRFFTLHDLKRSRQLAGTLFNVLFNLSKFMAYETRDPFVSRQVRALGPWVALPVHTWLWLCSWAYGP